MTTMQPEVTLPSFNADNDLTSFVQSVFANPDAKETEMACKQEEERGNNQLVDFTETEDVSVQELLNRPDSTADLAKSIPSRFSLEAIREEVEPLHAHVWGIGASSAGSQFDFPDVFKEKQMGKVTMKLSEASDGIFARKTTRNISEVAEYLMKSFEFAEVGRVLALYKGPDWILLPYQEAVYVFLEYMSDNQSDLFRYMRNNDFKDIYSKIMASPNIEHLEEIPLPDYHLLCCEDKLYDWHANEVLDGNSKYFRFSHLNMSADEIFPQETPYFDCFMRNVAHDHVELYQLILEVIGTIVTGYPTKHFFVFEGVPNSGKSQLSNFLKYILGPSACSSVNDINQLGERWTTGMLPGKLLCVCPDVPDKPLKAGAVGVIKKLTGDDPIQGERKYENPFVFQNTAKLLFLSNTPLRLANGSHDAGFQKRILRVPFYHAVAEEDQIPQLYEKLYCEAGGILWKSLQALQELEQRNGVFTHVDVEQYWEEQDPLLPVPPERIVRDFVDSCCVLDANAYVDCRSLYDAFEQFQKSRYGDEQIINNSYFGRLLCAGNYPLRPHRTGTARGYYGITLCGCDEISPPSEKHEEFIWREL